MGDLLRKIDRPSYQHQARALKSLRAQVLRDLAQRAPAHGPWWQGTTSGFWRHDPNKRPVQGRRQVIRCERCVTTGVEILVSGERSEQQEVRFWGLSDPCKD